MEQNDNNNSDNTSNSVNESNKKKKIQTHLIKLIQINIKILLKMFEIKI